MKYSIRENTDGGRTVFVTAGEYSQTIAWVLALVLLFDLSFSVGSQFAKETNVAERHDVILRAIQLSQKELTGASGETSRLANRVRNSLRKISQAKHIVARRLAAERMKRGN